MVGLIARIWAEFWLPAAMTDTQLTRLCGLRPHQLIELAERAPEALLNNNGRRLWRLNYCLQHIRGLR